MIPTLRTPWRVTIDPYLPSSLNNRNVLELLTNEEIMSNTAFPPMCQHLLRFLAHGIFSKRPHRTIDYKAVCYVCHGITNISRTDDEKGAGEKNRLLTVKKPPDDTTNFRILISHYISKEHHRCFIRNFYSLHSHRSGGMAILSSGLRP